MTSSAHGRAPGRGTAAVLVGYLLCATTIGGCSDSSVVAPSGATLSLSATSTALSFDATTTLTAQVLGANGLPVDGVAVSFATTLGSVQPAEAVARGGIATAMFEAGAVSGTATVTASAAGASTSRPLTIAIGVAAVARVTVSASPAAIPFGGGTATITAMVTDAAGNPLATIPVNFTTTAGAVAPASVKTDGKGAAQATLSTTAPAVVTATATRAGADNGSGSSVPGTTTVSVAPQPRPVVSIAASPNPVAMAPVTFTLSVTPAPGSSTTIENVSIAFGDGNRANMGAVSGANITAQHVYAAGGTYTVSATAIDSGGGVTTTPTVIAVGQGAPVSVAIAAAAPVRVGTQSLVTLIATIAPPTTIIQSYRWDFGDGTQETTTAPQVQHLFLNRDEPYRVTVTATPAGGGPPVSGFGFVVAPR